MPTGFVGMPLTAHVQVKHCHNSVICFGGKCLFILLQDTMDYVQTDGSAALKKAMERSEEFGQHSSKMSEIAREARALAEK
jgi:glucan biosynthesis protein